MLLYYCIHCMVLPVATRTIQNNQCRLCLYNLSYPGQQQHIFNITADKSGNDHMLQKEEYFLETSYDLSELFQPGAEKVELLRIEGNLLIQVDKLFVYESNKEREERQVNVTLVSYSYCSPPQRQGRNSRKRLFSDPKHRLTNTIFFSQVSIHLTCSTDANSNIVTVITDRYKSHLDTFLIFA